ncbi:porin [Thorsellia kenyensis]|uniref:Porin n=1 Tax=Thorsellia kenyensis TaxID=1549888 RepID=A0ABV6C9T0_9GAMM
MNRKILAVAITALLAANAANAAEIYNKDGNKIQLKGKVEAAYKFNGKSDFRSVEEGKLQNDKITGNHSNKDKTFVRFGFHGETQINSQLTGYGVFEHQFNPDNREGNTKDDDNTRLAYAGLKYANLGSLDFGRNVGVVQHVRDFTDNAPVFGGDGFGGGADQFLTGRASSLATYSVTDAFGYVDGLNMYLQYQAKHEHNDANKVREDHGNGFAFTTTYEHEQTGLGGAFTYANSDRTEDQRQEAFGTDGNHAEIWGIAAKYDANNIYAAISWAQSNNLIDVSKYGSKDGYYANSTDFAHKTRGLEVLANYTFDFGLTPSIVYNQLRARDLRNFDETGIAKTNAYVVKYIGVGAEYAFNKNIDMAVGYKFNLIDEDAVYTNYRGIHSDDQVEMRLTYNF